MLKQQKKNLTTEDMRAFRYTDLMKDFWTEEYMLAGMSSFILIDCGLHAMTKAKKHSLCSVAQLASVSFHRWRRSAVTSSSSSAIRCSSAASRIGASTTCVS